MPYRREKVLISQNFPGEKTLQSFFPGEKDFAKFFPLGKNTLHFFEVVFPWEQNFAKLLFQKCFVNYILVPSVLFVVVAVVASCHEKTELKSAKEPTLSVLASTAHQDTASPMVATADHN